MRDIDATHQGILAGAELRPFMLMDMEISGAHYRYTNCDVPLVLSGNLYEPRGMSIGNISVNAGRIVDQVTMQIANLDEAMTVLFVGTDVQGEPVTLTAVAVDASGGIVSGATLVLFPGEIDSWGLNEEKLNLTLTNEMARWSQRTLSRHPASCRWKRFKGTECGYTGTGAWCDRSYARCMGLGNQAHYGGYRFLPDLEDKEIYWGRTG